MAGFIVKEPFFTEKVRTCVLCMYVNVWYILYIGVYYSVHCTIQYIGVYYSVHCTIQYIGVYYSVHCTILYIGVYYSVHWCVLFCTLVHVYYSVQMDITVKTLLNTLKDPSVPLLEAQVFLFHVLFFEEIMYIIVIGFDVQC